MTPGDILREIVAHEHDCKVVEQCSLITEELGFDQWDTVAREFMKRMLPHIEEDPI